MRRIVGFEKLSHASCCLVVCRLSSGILVASDGFWKCVSDQRSKRQSAPRPEVPLVERQPDRLIVGKGIGS